MTHSLPNIKRISFPINPCAKRETSTLGDDKAGFFAHESKRVRTSATSSAGATDRIPYEGGYAAAGRVGIGFVVEFDEARGEAEGIDYGADFGGKLGEEVE
jgi:hypothetical protein